MPTYKLKYFNSRGGGEVSRLLFALAGQEYEDIRFTQETWPAEKPNTPFGQVPVLEIDDKQYGQGSAISRYLAKTFGLYGKDDIEALQVDQVLGIIQDVMSLLLKVYFEKDDAKRVEIIKDAKEDKGPNLMRMLEKVLKDNGSSGYCVGNKISLADVAVFDMFDKMNITFDFPMDLFPLVKKCNDLVGSNPKIKAWVEKRPVTDH